MTKELFAKKLIALRKQYNMTQQQLAEHLNVSNKTVSRWETAESYPDIDLLSALAKEFHVSTDYLLQDHQDFKELDKHDVISYIPWLMSIGGIFVYYFSLQIGIPFIFAFYIFYYITKFSYQFFQKYTDQKHRYFFVEMNTIEHFFVTQNVALHTLVLFYSLSWGIIMTDMTQFSMKDMNPNEIFIIYLLSFLIAGIEAYFHFTKHHTK